MRRLVLLLSLLFCLFAQPSGAAVTVGHSTLQIPCGFGVAAPVDWYSPSTQATGLVWLVHGWGGQKADMGLMAQAIAERDNAVVVVPTISSNPFDWLGCWILGAPMQQAVAKLFTGDRQALNASARSAGIQSLPPTFVLAGHSAGGQLALAVASYLDPVAFSSLRAVIGLDAGGDVAQGTAAMQRLPQSLPIYNLASPASQAPAGFTGPLRNARPSQFIGLEVQSGCHLDATGAVLGSSEGFLSWWFGCKLQVWNFEAYKTIVSDWILRSFTGLPSVGIVSGAPGQLYLVSGATVSVLP